MKMRLPQSSTPVTEARAELNALHSTGLTELLPVAALRFTALVGIGTMGLWERRASWVGRDT